MNWSAPTTNIYVLRLEGGRYYIGKSNNVIKRYQEHLSGEGPSWTQKYAPLSLEKTIEEASPFDEDKITKEYMSMYGIDKVRGGSYVNEIISSTLMEALRTELRTARDECTKCGTRGHFANECPIIIRNPVIPFRLNQHMTCFRCGRTGHVIGTCYARTHIKGYYL